MAWQTPPSCFQHEISDLSRNKVEQFVTRLYQKVARGSVQARVQSACRYHTKARVETVEDYFPKTGLIVGIRHPVWWFQSLYNFRTGFGPNFSHHPTS
jgi:hypothetical protein